MVGFAASPVRSRCCYEDSELLRRQRRAQPPASMRPSHRLPQRSQATLAPELAGRQSLPSTPLTRCPLHRREQPLLLRPATLTFHLAVLPRHPLHLARWPAPTTYPTRPC